MPVPTRVIPAKNIWVAAGDGDLDRVRELVEQQLLSPNIPDENTYTPMHAAASYGHIDILEYLVSRGGNVNITDEDGDTPLYVVENVETARWLVEHGAVVNRRNVEDISPAAALQEDFPEVAEYLESVSSTTPATLDSPSQNHPSQHAQNQITESLTTSLLDRVQDIMQRAEAEGRDPDEELRQAVGETVLEGMVTGYGIGASSDETRAAERDADDVKRFRTDDS
ncbi:ankyrin [Cristinia sonorae]|uniref:Ankyrin n=1 Tax=Cristinia sonorae TaxID=1940300 RepID=A0A8K0UML6_9AGAR|nr:ankyrin [Cristinia sonorae]